MTTTNLVDSQNIKNRIESALFVSDKPLSIEYLSKLLKEEERVVLRLVIELQQEYSQRGIRLRQVAGGFEMVSSDDSFEVVSHISKKVAEQPSKSLLETVTIVAYHQPVTRKFIQDTREVKDPDYGIQRSLNKGLIKETESGYITTEKFLEFFGINDLKELPPLEVNKTEVSGN
ncbi:SMC-Scp complex subunit ScpB [Bacillus cereus]